MTQPLIYRAVARDTDFEIRSVDGGSPKFTGYAAVFGSDSEPLPFVETIQPGAFGRSLKSDRDHTLVMDHDDTKLLASRRGRTLTLAEDSKGLYVEADLPDTSYARDLIELHGRGEARSMSFTFRVTKGGEMWSADNKRRTLTDLKLGHVSVLTGLPPAYRQTSASIRSLAFSIDADADALANAIEDLRDGKALELDECALIARTVASLNARWSSAANDASSATYALGSLLGLLGNESDDEAQSGFLKTAIDALQAFIAAETAEIGTEADLMASRSIPLHVRQLQIALAAKAR
jgi:HK97 family phage prohead protease